MRRHLVLAAAIALSASTPRAEADWIFRPSYYSHDPATGERVTQFAPDPTPEVKIDPTYQQSAYRHWRGALQVGDSFDYLHVVETWGNGENLRPYGEWLYPYRPGATPYSAPPYGPWGNPYGANHPYSPWSSRSSNPYALGLPSGESSRSPTPYPQYAPRPPQNGPAPSQPVPLAPGEPITGDKQGE